VPKYNIILNIPGFTIKKVSGHQPILFELEYHKKLRCPHCHSRHVRKKDSCIREVKHEMLCPRNWERPKPPKSLKTLVGAAGFEPATRSW
jgi:transposase